MTDEASGAIDPITTMRYGAPLTTRFGISILKSALKFLFSGGGLNGLGLRGMGRPFGPSRLRFTTR